MNPYKIVQLDSVGWTVTDCKPEDFAEWCAAACIKITGEHRSKSTRAELQGHPTTDKLCGPMWDGDRVRYESWQAYERLST